MELKTLKLDEVKPNPYQPRENFDEEKMQELANNIKAHGLIEPIVVTKINPTDEKYTIVAGERRWRASKKAGIKTIASIIKTDDYNTEVDAKKALLNGCIQRDSLVENAIRDNLNNKEFYDFCVTLAKTLVKETTKPYYTNEAGINVVGLSSYILGISWSNDQMTKNHNKPSVEGGFYDKLSRLKPVYEKGSKKLQDAVTQSKINRRLASQIARVDDLELQDKMLEWAKEDNGEERIKNALERSNIRTEYEQAMKGANVSDEKRKGLVNETYLMSKLLKRLLDWTSSLENFNAVMKEDKKFITKFTEENRHEILDKMKPLKKQMETFMELVGASMELIAEGDKK